MKWVWDHESEWIKWIWNRESECSEPESMCLTVHKNKLVNEVNVEECACMKWTWKLTEVNLEACELWLENKSKLAIQMAYMGTVQFFPDIISHLNFGAVETRMTTNNTPHTWVAVCAPQVFWHLPISSSRILEENVLFVLKSLLYSTSSTLTSWYSCIQEHHTNRLSHRWVRYSRVDTGWTVWLSHR